nr:MAG TPA: hypothetical protein [Caudoviricetes sp.]
MILYSISKVDILYLLDSFYCKDIAVSFPYGLLSLCEFSRSLATLGS